MNSRLEQFIRDNREDFDADEPSAKVWEGISQQFDPGKKTAAPVKSLWLLRWRVAAALLVLAGAGVWYIVQHKNTTTPQLAADTHKTAIPDNTVKNTEPVQKDTSAAVPAQENLASNDQAHNEDANSEDIASYNEEMYHYAKLVEIKHRELKKIEKDEPLLYKQFAGDVHKLDSVYHTLQKQLPNNPNREQLLEAMISNLQLQIGLLNHQLDIIKQINHSKKSAYEKAYKSA